MKIPAAVFPIVHTPEVSKIGDPKVIKRWIVCFLIAIIALSVPGGEATANIINIVFRLKHTPLGHAILQESDNGLMVTNIGADGKDGVRIDLPPNLSVWGEEHLPLGDINTTRVGATFTQTSSGIVGNVPNQTISLVKQTHLSDRIEIRWEFPFAQDLAGATVTAQYYLAGESVLTETGLSPLIIWDNFGNDSVVAAFGDDWKVDAECTISIPPRCKATGEVTGRAGPFVLFTPFENTVLTDQIALTLDAPNLPVIAYTDVSITAAGIPSFTITSELVQGIPSAKKLRSGKR